MKILILAYDFPPLISIGAMRPYSWYKYLPDNDIAVTVITRHWSAKISSPQDYVQPTSWQVAIEKDSRSNQVIRTGFKPNLRDRILLKYGPHAMVAWRKMFSYLYSFLEHLFFTFDSKAAIYTAAEKICRLSSPDLIIATGEPFILFKYAHRLSRRYGVPWLADYRDGWTSGQGGYKMDIVKNQFFRLLEKKYVGNASAVITASPTYADALAKIHPGKNVQVIYNGYDIDYFGDISNINPPFDKFIISYAGTIYPHQNLEMFLNGLDKFITAEKPAVDSVEARFFGMNSQPDARERLINYMPGLWPFIRLEPRTGYQDLVKQLRASHLLLLLSKNGVNWLNAKIFDYLAVKRKILLVENDHGIMEKILRETGGGAAVDNADEVCAGILDEYRNFKTGKVTEINSNGNMEQYSRKNQAGRLAGIIKKLNSAG